MVISFVAHRTISLILWFLLLISAFKCRSFDRESYPHSFPRFMSFLLPTHYVFHVFLYFSVFFIPSSVVLPTAGTVSFKKKFFGGALLGGAAPRSLQCYSAVQFSFLLP